jgi:hypothetical protein
MDAGEKTVHLFGSLYRLAWAFGAIGIEPSEIKVFVRGMRGRRSYGGLIQRSHRMRKSSKSTELLFCRSRRLSDNRLRSYGG